jgi:hypothetical protein
VERRLDAVNFDQCPQRGVDGQRNEHPENNVRVIRVQKQAIHRLTRRYGYLPALYPHFWLFRCSIKPNNNIVPVDINALL